ncbi:MAG: ribosomal protein L13e [Candidatus Aenigmarchaeota archaeon]|nr:ribosomal protein L13e [Candidatus Aenigmarchaeota archaeon]
MKEKLEAIVKSSDGHVRKGKGFSRAEISHVGLTIQQAKKLGIPIDKRRKTAYVENINKLMEFLKKGKKKSAS